MYLPSIAQGHHMIDIDVACCCPRRAIVRTEPASRCRRARRVGYDTGAISFQDRLTRVARSGLSDPVRKQVTGVAGLRSLGGNGEAGKLGSGGGRGGNVGRSASDRVNRCWSCRDYGG